MLEEKDLIPQAPSDITGVSVLALAAHPDDEVLGCGGTLALHVRKGDPVRVLVVTGGEKGDFQGRYGEGYVALREEEDRRALTVLGIRDVEFWRLPDRELHQAGDLVGRLREALERHRPGLVYCPSPSEIHPDHRALAHALWEAAGAVGFAGKIAFYEVSAPLRPNTLVDITPVVEQKKAAIQCYRSQLKENDYLEKTLGLNRFRSYTLPSETQYAEAFWAVAPSSVHPAPLDRVLAEQSRIPSETKDQPLVSIIVRTKDRPKLLEEALASIQQQTYRNLEVIVVNDGGVDVEDVVRKFEPFFKVCYVAHPENRGRSAAANTGLSATMGQYIGFLDDDDLLFPDHVDTLVGFLAGKEHYQAAYTDSICGFYFPNQASGEYELQKREVVFAKDFDPEMILFDNFVPNACLLFSRKAVQSSKVEFDESLEVFEDWDFLVRVSRTLKFCRIRKVTVEYRIFDASTIQDAHSRRYSVDEARKRIYDKNLTYIDGAALWQYIDAERCALMAECRKSSELDRIVQEVTHLLAAAQREKEVQVVQLQSERDRIVQDVTHLLESVRQKEQQLEDMRKMLLLIETSLSWRMIGVFRKVKNWFLPNGTRRRALYDLLLKGIKTYIDAGWWSFYSKACIKLQKILRRPVSNQVSLLREDAITAQRNTIFVKRDVLFVSGCPGDASRYRGLHQQEQLEKFGYSTAFAFYDQVDLLSLVPYYYYFILHRVPMTESVSAFIRRIQDEGKIVFYDTDDLVFDESYAKYVDALRYMGEAEKVLYYDGLKRYGMTLRMCPYAIVTTEYLAEEIQKLGITAFINRNSVSNELVELSSTVLASRKPRGASVVIGYFSGTPTHNADFACVSNALLKILQKYPHATLLLVGHLIVPELFESVKERIVKMPLVPWRQLPHLIASVDINLVPLEKNPFCEAKSELKYLEAALVEVPTVASAVGGYNTAITNGENGLLASKDEEWIEALSLLIENPTLRRKMGHRARNHVLMEYTTDAIGKKLTRILNRVRCSRIKKESLNLGWVLQAPFKGSGGYTSIFRMLSLLARLGHQSTVYIDPIAHLLKMEPVEIMRYIERHFDVKCKIVVGHDQIQPHNVLIATSWPTAPVVASAKWSHRKAYFVQDYEPDLYELEDPIRHCAEDTYKLGLYCLTLGPYLSLLLHNRYGLRADYIDFGVDSQLFFPPSFRENHKKKIIFYARPETKRRGFEIGVAALERVYKEYQLEIMLYGSDDLKSYNVRFPYVDLGILPPHELAERFREADIGISISLTNLSFVPLEMMACGCVPIEIDSPRCEGTLINRENCLLVKPTSEGIALAIQELLENADLLQGLSTNGIVYAKERTWERSAKQFVTHLLREVCSEE